MARSRFFLTIATLVALLPAASIARAETAPPAPRDTLRKAMEPMIDILSREPVGPSRAFGLRATVTASTAQPPELIGSHISLYLQPADNKALFQFLANGYVVTVCRQGQSVWAAPADKLAPLLAQVQGKPPTKADKEPLASVRLKVPVTLFWLLFRLVPVKDAGSGELNGAACRKVDVKPPDSDDKNGYMRLWIRADNSAPARLEWHGADSQSTITVDEAKFVGALPPETWDPAGIPPEARLPVPAERFRPLMNLIGKKEEARRKQMRDAAKAASGTTTH